MRVSIRLCLVLLALGLPLTGARAQEVIEPAGDPEVEPMTAPTRAERLRAQREEKRGLVRPPREPFLARLADGVAGAFEESGLGGITLPRIGKTYLSPKIGGMQPGAGRSLGLVFKPTHRDDRLHVTLAARASVRGYWEGDGVLGYDNRRLLGYGYGRYRHMDEEDFYGLGTGTMLDDEVDYRLDEFILGGLTGWSPLPRTLVGVQGAYLDLDIGRGDDPDVPDLMDVYEPGALPGRDSDVTYAVVGAFAEYDARNVPHVRGYGARFALTRDKLLGLSLDATEGILLGASLRRYQQLPERSHGFFRLDAQAQEFFPVRNEFHGFAFRQLVQLTWTESAHDVPFYMMPHLGGKRSLRGYDDFRFRGSNLALVNAEYRWHAWFLMDLVAFVDVGQVFERFEELGRESPEVSYGVAARLRAGRRVIAGLSVAFGREGTAISLRGGGFL